MSTENKDKKTEEQKEVPKENGGLKKVKEVQKDAEVLRLLEEDEDDFEEFEEGGNCHSMQHTNRILLPRWRPSSGGRTGTTRISTMSLRSSSRGRSALHDLHETLGIHLHITIKHTHNTFK